MALAHRSLLKTCNAAAAPVCRGPARRRATCSASATAAPAEGLQNRPQAQAAAVQQYQQRRILVAVDDTEESWAAVSWTCQNVVRAEDVLCLVHLVPRNSTKAPLPAMALPHALSSVHESMDYEDLLDAHAREIIRQSMAGLPASVTGKRPRCEVEVLHVGDSPACAAKAICNRSAELGAALVVVAQRPKSWFEQLMTGPDISGSVLAQCKQPTLVFNSEA